MWAGYTSSQPSTAVPAHTRIRHQPYLSSYCALCLYEIRYSTAQLIISVHTSLILTSHLRALERERGEL